MCPAFRASARRTAMLISEGRLLRLVPWETTLTDLLLLDVGRQFPGRVLAHRFSAAREAESGADWEWWFRDESGFAGMRVQAKRRHPDTGRFGLQDLSPGPPPRELQLRRLVRRARVDGLSAFYCLYSDRVPLAADPASTGPCPHGMADPAQWGVSLLPAVTALRHVQGSRNVRADTVASSGRPWWSLVCAGPTVDPGPVAAVRRFVMDMHVRELIVRQAADEDLSDADFAMLGQPPVGIEPPEDVVVAFRTRSTAALTGRDGVSGVALFDATGL